MAFSGIPAVALPLDTDRAVIERLRLRLDVRTPLQMQVLRDDYRFAADQQRMTDRLPAFDFNYIRAGGRLIPEVAGSQPGDHPHWEYILEPGRAWRSTDAPDELQLALPFTLQERNANCMHNGVIRLSLESGRAASPATVQIASETCMYFKFDLWGQLPARTGSEQAGEAARLVLERADEQQATQLPRLPVTALADLAPGEAYRRLTGADNMHAEHVTAAGFIIDDKHYAGTCFTRLGPHPFCDTISLPSYSLAKSVFAGLGLMRLERLYPGSREAVIADHVPQCRAAGHWADVSFEQALNMRTGNYGSPQALVDEGSAETDRAFFFAESHGDKLRYSCTAWPRRAAPGSRWVYHTTDTYVLGSAMSDLLRQRRGPQADLADDLVLPLLRPLRLSASSATVRRSAGPARQAWTGFGMTFTPDDIGRLAAAINRGDFADSVDTDMYRAALLQSQAGPADYHNEGEFSYRHGFWSYDAAALLGCEEPLPIPFMSGYGGINVLMMPNDTVYYRFADSGRFAFTDAILFSHGIRPLCSGAGRKNESDKRGTHL